MADTLRLIGGGAGTLDAKQSFVLSDLVRDSIGIIANLADGYNRYYSADKAKCYSRARTCVCRVQCLLLLASSLGLLGNKEAEELCKRYEERLRMFNGLIKLFEEVR